MESQTPAWITKFLQGGGATRSGLLEREELQAQLRELEGKILAHVAETQGKSAREAAASLSLTLQKEGVIGVTEEVRTKCPLCRLLSCWGTQHLDSAPCWLGGWAQWGHLPGIDLGDPWPMAVGYQNSQAHLPW